jgi:citronellol/citronellal dehydrogenase
MGELEGRIFLVTGASRGIGRAIALRLARDGARLVLAAKSTAPHPKLPGTVHTVAEEVRSAGGEALALKLDVRDDAMIASVVEEAVARFGGLDGLINNAGAISLTGTADTAMKRYDLLMNVNVRAAFACTKACLSHLERSEHAHVLNMSPPLSLDPRWIAPHAAYTISKYGMSLLTIGLAAELASKGVAVNSLWPKTTIATAAVEVHFPQVFRASRRPEIVADAAHAILRRAPATSSGHLYLDEEVLREEGVDDFSGYAVTPGVEPHPDLYV